MIAVLHSEAGGLGLLEPPLLAAGIELVPWRPYAGEPAPSLDDADGLVAMGGLMNPDEDATHAWLADERALIADALERGSPVLGICLGAQLLAQAAGGAAERLAATEIGWLPIELADAAADDPLLRDQPSGVVTFHWHSWACVPPPGAVELARTARSLQAFRVGAGAWAIQFHPEVDADRVARWSERGAATLERNGLTPAAVAAESLRHEAGQLALGTAIGSRFAAAVAARLVRP